MEKLLRKALDPSAGATIFAIAIAAFYGIGTWYANLTMSTETRSDMTFLPWISAIGILIGSRLLSKRPPAEFLDQRAKPAVCIMIVAFLIFCAATVVTASSLPLKVALEGATPEDIAVARENFLKAREGWQAILPYVNGLLTGSILPYCMCIALLRRYRFRWLIVALFFTYSVFFVEKAFFLRVLLPLMAVVVVTQTQKIKLSWLLFGAIFLLILNISISGFAESSGMGISNFLLFRVFSVPLATATDSLDYWHQTYHGAPLLGATNLVFSTLFRLPRILFEQEVFVYEWGDSATGTASSNAVFFIEAYVNFGWIGVVVVSMLVGALLAYIGRSSDQAFRCLLPLVMYSLFLSGALSVLFGNGLLACVALSTMLSRRARRPIAGVYQAPG